KFSSRFILAGAGLLFAFIGNYMHNIKPNYFAGFRLPWTLENEENWKKTHALAGKLWFVGGIFISVICLLLPPKPSIAAFYTIMIVITLIPCVYSYRLYRKQKTLTSVN
ncbi:MAG: SdpI family protein, partial [Bacteroidota bacterium]|nr:SdpI family protein [Bacteroidota bacterium]